MKKWHRTVICCVAGGAIVEGAVVAALYYRDPLVLMLSLAVIGLAGIVILSQSRIVALEQALGGDRDFMVSTRPWNPRLVSDAWRISEAQRKSEDRR